MTTTVGNLQPFRFLPSGKSSVVNPIRPSVRPARMVTRSCYCPKRLTLRGASASPVPGHHHLHRLQGDIGNLLQSLSQLPKQVQEQAFFSARQSQRAQLPKAKDPKARSQVSPAKAIRVPQSARKRDKQTGKCVRSKKRSAAAQQKRNLRKRLHQVKQHIRQDAQASNDSVHSECEVEELSSPSSEPSAEESAQPASSDESSLSV